MTRVHTLLVAIIGCVFILFLMLAGIKAIIEPAEYEGPVFFEEHFAEKGIGE